MKRRNFTKFAGRFCLCVGLISVLALCGFCAVAAELPDELVPIGQTAGIKLYANGVVVEKLNTDKSGSCPAKAAGLKPGDLITAVNGRIITENRDLTAALSECAGVKTELRVNRNGQELTLTVTPEKGLKGEVKIGASVRDSMAGIGTVTYFDPEASTFGSLGHGICQSENGCLFPVGSGCLVPSTVVGVNRGTEGEPGELLGEFEGDKNSGSLTGNTVSGLFGEIEKDSAFFLNGDEKAIPVGEGIEKGKAYIMSNIYDKEVNLYEIEVVKIVNSERGTRNFIIRVTDTVLLEATGGIVQGMSGSPIIQNGKLVGAVTHVLVNDPTMGYGILIENMLNSDPAYAEQNAA